MFNCLCLFYVNLKSWFKMFRQVIKKVEDNDSMSELRGSVC